MDDGYDPLTRSAATEEIPLATNTGEGFRRGQVRDRYQQYNPDTDRYDKYDGDANYVDSKITEGPYKGIEERAPKKPPRG